MWKLSLILQAKFGVSTNQLLDKKEFENGKQRKDTL